MISDMKNIILNGVNSELESPTVVKYIENSLEFYIQSGINCFIGFLSVAMRVYCIIIIMSHFLRSYYCYHLIRVHNTAPQHHMDWDIEAAVEHLQSTLYAMHNCHRTNTTTE